MNRSFYFTSRKSGSAFGLRIVSTVYNCYLTVLVGLVTGTCYKVCLHKTYFIAREETEIFLRRFFHEVFTLNIKFTTKRNLSGTKLFILQIVCCIQILNFSFDLTQPVFWVAIVGGFANQLLTYTSDQSVVQRYLTVKDSSDAKKGLWLNGFLAIPIAFLFFGIGTALFVFFKQHPDLLSIGMNNTDSIYPHYMMIELPKGLAGLLISAVFAAAMSTLSSNINSSTVVMSEDFYAKLKPSCTDEDKLRFAKISGVVVGGLGIVMAIALATFDIASLWDQFNFFLGLLTSGLGGLFMMGIFTKRIGTRAAFAGFFGSIAVLLCCSAFTAVTSTLYGFIGLISCFIIGYLSSFIFGYRK